MSSLRWLDEQEQECRLPQVFRLDDEETSAREADSADEEDAAIASGRIPAFSSEMDNEDDTDPTDDADAALAPGRMAVSGLSEKDAGPAFAPDFADPDADPATVFLPSPGQTLRLADVRPTRRGRAALFCQDAAGEEQFLFSVDTETAARLHLAPGARLSGEELREARRQSDLRAAKDKALQYLAVRDYAAAELAQKLQTRFDEHTAAAAVAEMQRLQLLDDAAFAVHRAAYLAKKGKSRRVIAHTLSALGVDRDSIDAALQALPDEEEETLRALVQKQYAAKLAAGKRDNVAAALLRRGFSGALVRRVLREFAAGED